MQRENRPCSVDAVDAEIVERPAAAAAREPDVPAVGDLHGEARREETRVADAALAYELEHTQRRRVEVQAIGGHQPHVVAPPHGDHLLALPFGERERFLAEDVHTRAGGAKDAVVVQVVRERDVDRVDVSAPEEPVELVVADGMPHSVLPLQRREFLVAPRHQGDELRVAPGIPKCRQDGFLGDVAQSDDRVAHTRDVRGGAFARILFRGQFQLAVASGGSSEANRTRDGAPLCDRRHGARPIGATRYFTSRSGELMSTIASRASARLARTVAALVVLAVPAMACGGGEQTADTTAAVTPGADTTTPAGGAGGAGGALGAPPAGATAAMVAEGDSIFKGQKAGGACFTCHGADANGTPLAPSLTDTTWRTGDGSYAFIQQRVKEGVPQPAAPYTAPMPPMGGATLSEEQVRSVAAYVYTLSHR
jgi:mono/diheme cytochrome c family protein